jgi:hypothetical protein
MCCDERALHISGMLGEQVHSAWLKVSWEKAATLRSMLRKERFWWVQGTLLVGTKSGPSHVAH